MKLEEVKDLKTESVCGMLQPQTAFQGVTGGKDVFLPYYLPLEAYNGDQTYVSKGPCIGDGSIISNGLCKS